MRRMRRAGIITIVVLATSVIGISPIIPVSASMTITIDGSGSGRSFQGIGGVSAGAAARLLYDYPSAQQNQIYDYLFKPNFGASLQRLKVEIGGDENSTWGSEPSIRRSGETAPGYTSNSAQCRRGYEFSLMKAAITRNPNISLDALEWGAPGWIGGAPPNFWSQDNAYYVNDFIDCAAEPQNQVNGSPLPISTVGLWNETPWATSCGGNGIAYIKGTGGSFPGLYQTLQNRGHSNTKIVAADETGLDLGGTCGDASGFDIASNITNDATLSSEVADLGAHYTLNSTTTAQGLINSSGHQSLWATETTDDPSTAAGTAVILNRNYLVGKETATFLCCLIDAYFSSIYSHQVGLITSQTPWGSAGYSVLPQLWAVAHTTQFAQPGWIYLENGASVCLGSSNCGNLKFYSSVDCSTTTSTGSVVTLKSSGSNPDFSSVVETVCATSSQSLQFNLSNVHTLSCGCVHVWKSDLTAGTYLQESDYSVSGGVVTLNASPNSIYTVTTTTGQQKGSYTQNAASAFPFPWSENYDSSSYAVGGLPHYLSDQHGAFEVQPCDGGYTGNCLEQVVTAAPIGWANDAAGEPPPATVLGSLGTGDYSIQSKVLFEPQSGTARILARIQDGIFNGSGGDNYYQFAMTNAGTWSLQTIVGDVVCSSPCLNASGTVPAPGTGSWHTMKVSLSGSTIKIYYDNLSNPIYTTTDSTYSAGGVGLGTGWNKVQFKQSCWWASDPSSCTSLVTGVTLGTNRNNFSGPVGMEYTTGNSSITVTQLGRIFVAGNTGSHTVAIYPSGSGTAVAYCTVNTSTGTADSLGFKYCTLPSPYTLAANTTYEIASTETSNGDHWYDWDSSISVGTGTDVAAAFYNSGSWGFNGSAGATYGPVNLIFN